MAAEGLRLVQLDGTFHHLKQWDHQLEKREQEILIKRGELIKKTQEAQDRQKDIYHRLQGAKAAT